MRTNSLGIAALMLGAAAHGQSSFVNWESPHVHPLDVTPDGARVLAVNTADNRLEVFDVTGQTLTPAGSVPVGLDPVTVRARTDTEAWVVNHVSDSISVVDLSVMHTVATISTGDEPADVVFAGTPQRAYVSLSQLNKVRVYDPADLSAAPVTIDIEGEDPRAMAVSGNRVYVAIFESGNRTTILNEQAVSSALNPYAGDPNPPPNVGSQFVPAQNLVNPPPPHVGMIVRKHADGSWRDDNGADWSAAVTWDLHDHDVAVIDTGTQAVSHYVTGAMNLVMGIAARPDGIVLVAGTDADNDVRFSANLEGVFSRVVGAAITPTGTKPAIVVDLNPHLSYTPDPTPLSAAERAQSLGDPRGIAVSSTNATFFTGMGSNNVVVLQGLSKLATIPVGEGPTGVVLNPSQTLAFVLNRFEATISTIDTLLLMEMDRTGFYDPTPAAIRIGRPHLFDTHKSSALGHLSCASCHVDARMDQLAWDLGDPDGDMRPFTGTCNSFNCSPYHPMKGPMTTQTLQGIIGTEPLHWRGDRDDLAEFNPAFESLLGLDSQLTAQEMQEFEDYVATIAYPPNPFRNPDNTLADDLGDPSLGTGSPAIGGFIFNGGGATCFACHALPTGTNTEIVGVGVEPQSFKVAQLRNMHEKTGFDAESMNNNRGFGYIHDGSDPTLFEFLQFFQNIDDTQRTHLDAFLMSFSIDTHAGVGTQVTVDGTDPTANAVRDQLIAIADGGEVALVYRGRDPGGNSRGGFYLGNGLWQTDRGVLTISQNLLNNLTAPGREVTYTLVPLGTEVRIGVDRDEDGFFDRDEVIAGSDPADPNSTP